MTTLKEFQEKHAKQLDEDFIAKYPNGKFIIQHFSGDSSLHWERRRRTSHAAFGCVSVRERDNKIEILKYRNSSFGNCRSYKSFEKMLAAIDRDVAISAALKCAFIETYLAWKLAHNTGS